MKNPNHDNPACESGEQLVPYLYGETMGLEKRNVEQHLKICTLCADELAAFSDVRFAVTDWKNEFSQIETPVIEIPFENNARVIGVSNPKVSPVKVIRGLFANFPTFATAAGAFAALAVFAGLTIYLMSPGNESDLAEKNRNTSIPKTAVNTESENFNQNNPGPGEQPPDKMTENQILQPAQVSRNATQNQPTEKINNTQLIIPKVDNKIKPNQRKPLDINNKGKQTKNSLPGLVEDDEDEDKTLRLADLFEEIGTDD